MRWNRDAGRAGSPAASTALRVALGIYPQHLDRAIAEGLRTGDEMRRHRGGLVTGRPLKVVTDGSLNTRTA